MRAFKNKTELGYWHGDIKPENILMKKNGVALIDWAGSRLFQDAAKACSGPESTTAIYMNSSDKKRILDMLMQQDFSKTAQDRLIKSANNMDLYSLAIVLYSTLVPLLPFLAYYDMDLEEWVPDTREGLPANQRIALFKKKYSRDIVEILTKMLAQHAEDRYSIPEAFDMWESIDEVTGKFRKSNVAI